MVCKLCRREVPDSANFCIFCGIQSAAAGAAGTETNPQTQALEALKSVRSRWKVFAVAVLGAIFFGAFTVDIAFAVCAAAALAFWILTTLAIARAVGALKATGATVSDLWVVAFLILGPLGCLVAFFFVEAGLASLRRANTG